MGGWRCWLEAGGWSEASGWRWDGGGWLEEAGCRQVEAGGWRQVVGGWRQMTGCRWLEVEGWREVAGGRWWEVEGWSGGWSWWLEGGGMRMVVWLAWLVGWYGWSGGYSVWRIATEPSRNSAILAIHIPLNTAYVSVSTEPPD